MKESLLRSAHRKTGVVLFVFVLVQTVTGIVLSVENMFGAYWGGIIHDLHEGYGLIGNVYRFLLGIALAWMAVSGWMIYIRIRGRMKGK